MCRKRNRIAAILCLSLLIGTLAPAESVFASYGSSSDTETHNKASQSLGSYSTAGYRVYYYDEKTQQQTYVDLPPNKTTEEKGDKIITTNTLDFSALVDAVGPENVGQFQNEDGTYNVTADVIFSVTIDKAGNTDTYVGKDLANAPDAWGGAWSSKTNKNINSTKDSICDVQFGYPAPTSPPPPTDHPTPVPKTDLITPPVTSKPVTPIPTNKPTDTPKEDVPPTMPPTPKPTEPPAPPTPFPTPEPKTYVSSNTYEYNKYYTSTNGHSISDIAVNGKIADDTGLTSVALADAIGSVGTRTAYTVGTDSRGNEWYLISSYKEVPNGYGYSTREYYATSVHPKKYGGHAVESTAVRYISTLVYPETIVAKDENGNTWNYKVISIGGSGPYYYSNATTPTSGTEFSDLGAISGSYSWKSGVNKCGFTYLMGSVGNGTILSNGYGVTSYTDYDTYVNQNTYITNYYVYNTTLSSITIPANCETIEDYAFHNCQALLIIKGGDNLTTIGKNAFSVSEPPEFKRSYKPDAYANAWDRYSYIERIYSYDDSYTINYMSEFPSAEMKKFEGYVTIGNNMAFPSLPKLITIGESAFEGRYHLNQVMLSKTVTTINKDAFKNCKLDRIAVPNEKTNVKGGYDTLGTKGPDVNFLTEIVTPSTSPAYPRMYGELYDAYYRVFQDAYIYYHPNGANPDAVQTEMAEIEYKEASFGDSFIDIGEGCILWLGDDGCIYYAYIDDTNVLRGNLVTALRGYRFSSLNTASLGSNYYEAVTSTGAYCYINAVPQPVYGYKTEYYDGPDGGGSYQVSYVRYYAPAVSYFFMPGNVKCTSIQMLSMSGVSEKILEAISADGRHHWNYKTKWVSESPYPEGVTVTHGGVYQYSLTELGSFWQYTEWGSGETYFRINFYQTILCSNGSVYTRQNPTGEWFIVEGTYDAISPGYKPEINSYRTTLYKIKDSTYYSSYYIEFGYKYDAATGEYKYLPTLKTSADTKIEGALLADPIVQASAISIDEPVLYAAGNSSRAITSVAGATTDSSSTTINGVHSYQGETVSITQDTSTKKMTWHYHCSNDSGYNTSSEYPGGTGTFLAARCKVATNYQYGGLKYHFMYYFGSDGCLYSTYGEFYSVKTFKVSDVKLVQYWLLNASFAPMEGGSWGSSDYESSGNDTHSYSSGSTSTSDVINIIGLDADGYIWGGALKYGEATFTKLSDNVFTKVLYKEIAEKGTVPPNSYYDNASATDTYARFYAIDTNKDLYKYDKLVRTNVSGSSFDTVGYVDPETGYWVTTGTTSHSGSTTTYYGEEEMALEYMDYDLDIERFLSYPIILMAGNKPGLLTTTDAVTDIYCGVEIVYRISQNKWFIKNGSEFVRWNTAADGTGTNREVGQRVVATSYDSNWQTSAQDVNLYAQWGPAVSPIEKTQQVYYYPNGGYGSMPTQTVPVGTNQFTVSANGFTAYPGYEFAGYYTANPEGTGTKYYPGASATITTDFLTLYAQWKPISYTVKFAYDEYRAEPAWFFNTATIPFDRSFAMPAEPQKKELRIDYDINTNSSMSTAALAQWQTARPFSEDYTVSRARFIGWDKYFFRNGEYISGYLRYDEYEEVSGITDIKNDVVAMFPVWGGIDGYVLLPYATCPGYELFGWMDARKYEDANDVADYIPENGGGMYLPKANDTLYAWWEPCEYEITFVQTMEGRNPDVAGTPSVTMTFDEVCPSVTAPHIEKYVFVGYNTKPDGSGVWYYGEADRDTHITSAYVDEVTGQSRVWQVYDGSVKVLYAQWRPDKAIKYEPNYTWTPDNALANDVYSIDSILGVEDNTVFVVTDEPTFMLEPLYYTRRGYTFKHWTLHADGTGNAFADRAVIETNAPWLDGIIPIYAQWMPNPYTIAYDLKGNKPNASTETQIEQAPTAAIYDVSFTVTNPVKKGYDFLGWDIAGMSECTHYVGSNTTNVTSLTGIMDTSFKNLHHAAGATVTFTAMWKVKEFDVILNDRGATSTGHTEQVHMIFDEYGPDIIVPTKTGYTFHGYYTGIRGAGKQYYDENGICVVPWTEDDVYELFAYWVQDPVLLPDEDDHIDPVVPPQTDSDGMIGRTDHKGLLYADDYNDATGALTDLQPYLTYDTPASEGVIPGTEYLALRAKMGSWMLSYKFHRMSGTDTVNIVVTVPYRTQYEIEETEELVISDLMTATYTIPVPKSWSYWEVVESGMYYPDKLTVRNEAMKEPVLEVEVDRTGANAVAAPQYSAKKYGDKENHVKWQEYDGSGTPTLYIEFPEQQYIISNKLDTPPDIAPHLGIICRNAAWADTRQAEVRSDKYEFDGNVILSDVWQTQHGAELDKTKLPATAEDIEFTSYEQTYKSGIELDELKPNGKYETTAVVTYVGDEENIGTPATKEVDLTDINDLNIHTPVACDGVFTDGIEYKTDENGTELAVLTLKEALNFFTLRIDNTGIHRMNLGYGTKDFAFALSGKSNVAEADGTYLNQVKYPFDVYVDMGSDSRNADGTYNTTGDCFFESGTWLTIGNEEKTFYVPVTQKNGTYQIEFRTIAVNLGRKEEYSDTMELYIQQYTNTNPEKYIASDAVELTIQSYLRDFLITGTDDSHAEKPRKQGKQALVLKKGYQYSFDLLSQGEFYGENTKLCITPSFFWVSEDETEREEVILYSETYQAEQKPRECYKWEGIPLLEQHQFHEVILQRFSGTGYLPEDVLCVPVSLHQKAEEYMKRETITGKENFFKQTGYLVIHFDIKLRSEEGVWYSFDHWENTGIYRDAVAAEWNYIPGDVIRYDLSKSISDDYEIGGIE